MKLVIFLILSLSTLLCSVTHGSAASTYCPAIESIGIDGDITSALGADVRTSPTEPAAPSDPDLTSEPAHCVVGHPAIRSASIEMPATGRENVRLVSEVPMDGRNRDRIERPPTPVQ